MNNDATNHSFSTPIPKVIFSVLLGAIVLVVVALILLWQLMGNRGEHLQAGELAPPIQGAGWVNGPAPSVESLKGKVIVLEAWASW